MFLTLPLPAVLPKSRLVVTGHSNGRFTATTMRRHARPLPFKAAPPREAPDHDAALIAALARQAVHEGRIAAARADLAAVRGMG